MSRCSTNKEAWEKLFQKYNIINGIKKNGYFKITSKEINEYREARLMTKFDNSEAIPEILKKNKLSILPVTSNSYMIANFETYKKFEKIPKEIEKVEFLSYIESLDYNNITSEALALNCAYITKILEDFLEEEELVPTVSGKMGSGNFEFQIGKINSTEKIDVTVENSRIEIDGGYEGINSLALVEAKNIVSEDFLVRQLYYLYRLWKSKIDKNVRPIYAVYSNGIFTMYEYKFLDDNEYSSIELVKCKRYSIEDTNIDLGTIQELINNTKQFIEEPEVSFPQANNFDRVINLCELLKNSEKDKQERKFDTNYLCKVQNCINDLKQIIEYAKYNYSEISIWACSMGAYFSLLAYNDEDIKQCLFISPVVNMKIIINNMMIWSNTTENDSKEKQEIKTDFGQILYWDYYLYVKENPITNWHKKTYILYGNKDNMQDENIIKTFSNNFDCKLSILENGEHYFHTKKQLSFYKD